ncbi:MAG: pilus assembly PilX N-terminal domain-containing protein [bacterium]
MLIKLKYKKGVAIVTSLIFGTIAVIIITGLVGWFAGLLSSSRALFDRERAFQVAESGIDYYRWHLAHNATDFTDGTTTPGPYVHIFEDKDGNALGEFSLDISRPATGSTIVSVVSTGKVYSNPNITRKIKTLLAKPSMAKYSVVGNVPMRFGQGTEVYGPVQINNGVRFDGIAHNIISSTVASYDDPDHSDGLEFGVHTHVNAPPDTGVDDTFRPAEAPPSTLQTRTDVFMAGRQFPVPAYDFSGLTANMAQLKALAQSAGFYYPGSSATAKGVHVVLNTNNTFDLYTVDQYYVPADYYCLSNSWSIQSQTLVGNYPFPVNGIMYFDDHVFVDGVVSNGARITIAAGKLPDDTINRKSIIIDNNLLYTHKDGTEVIALIAQADVNVGLVSSDNLEIDGALVAQNGRVGRPYYDDYFCSPYGVRNTISLYGMIASNQRYGFAYSDGTGYTNRNITYDANLLYAPPPSFPLTSDQYITISWEEIK